MNENCRDCIQVDNLEKRVTGLEQSYRELYERISEVERGNAVSEERIRMVFKILNEIKDSIRQIGDKIDKIEQKPAKRWDEAAGTVMTVVITAIVAFIVSRIF